MIFKTKENIKKNFFLLIYIILTAINILPLNKTSYTSSDSVIRFRFDKCAIDFSNLALFVDVVSTTATSSFPETCGTASLFSNLKFKMGGATIANIDEYPSYVANEFTRNQKGSIIQTQTAAISTGQTGVSSLWGKGELLTATTSAVAATLYQVPLLFNLTQAGSKINLSDFTSDAFLELTPNADAKALFDSAGSPTYAIHNLWLRAYKCPVSECIKFGNGKCLNINTTTHAGTVAAATSDIIRFPSEYTNATKILINFNEDATGYTTATDEKFRSIMRLTGLQVRTQGSMYPSESIGSVSTFEPYIYSYEATFGFQNGFKMNYLYDQFIAKTKFFASSGEAHGFFALSLIETPKFQPLNPMSMGKVYKGKKLGSSDYITYTQSSASDNVNIWIQHTRKLIYNGAQLTYYDSWN